MLAFDVCRRWQKPLPLESMDSHEYHLQAAGFFLVHGISHPILGSQDALIEVGEVFRL